MKLIDVFKILEFGARFELAYFKKGEVQKSFFRGNLEDYKKKSLGLEQSTVKVIQSMPQMEFKIVLSEV